MRSLMGKRLVWLMAAAACLQLTGLAGAEPLYTVTDLGMFTPTGINNAGQVVGTYYTSVQVGPNTYRDTTYEYLYDHGKVTDLTGVFGTYAGTLSINNAGQVAGTNYTIGGGQQEAILYSNGNVTVLAGGGYSTVGTQQIPNAASVAGINDLG
jgi:uncharacterized membrane protein